MEATYIESTKEADERIRNVAHEVSFTASALAQLQILIEVDEKAEGNKIFKEDGLQAVNDTATQCNVVFKRIVEHLNSAGYADNISTVSKTQLGSQLKINLNGLPNDSLKEELEERVLALSEKEKQAAQRLQKDGEPNSLPDISSTDNGSRSQILPAVVNPELNLKSLISSTTYPNGNSDDTEINRDTSGSIQSQKDAEDRPKDQLSSLSTPLPAVVIQPPDELADFQIAQTEHHRTNAVKEDVLDLEAWIARGLHNILKMPIEQDEIMLRMQEITNDKSHRPWDDLIALPASRQKEVAKVLELAKQEDREELSRILAAISIIEPISIMPIRERSFGDVNTPTMLIFLEVKKRRKERVASLLPPMMPDIINADHRDIKHQHGGGLPGGGKFRPGPPPPLSLRPTGPPGHVFGGGGHAPAPWPPGHLFEVKNSREKKTAGQNSKDWFISKRRPSPPPLLYWFAGRRRQPSTVITAESSDWKESSSYKQRRFTQRPFFLRRPSFLQWPLRTHQQSCSATCSATSISDADGQVIENVYEREEEVIPEARPTLMNGPINEGGVHELASHPDTMLPNRDYGLGFAEPETPRDSTAGFFKSVQKHQATFQCTLCPERFTRGSDLRLHLQTLTDESAHICAVCGKPFADQFDRQRHEDLHSGGKTNLVVIGVEGELGIDSGEKKEQSHPLPEFLRGVQYGPLPRASSTKDVSDSVLDLTHYPILNEKVVDNLLSSWTTVFE